MFVYNAVLTTLKGTTIDLMDEQDMELHATFLNDGLNCNLNAMLRVERDYASARYFVIFTFAGRTCGSISNLLKHSLS